MMMSYVLTSDFITFMVLYQWLFMGWSLYSLSMLPKGSPFKTYKDVNLQPRRRKKIKTRKRLVRNYFNNHHWKRAKLKPRPIMMYASESDLPKWKSALKMDFSPFISRNFDPVKQFKSIKALNKVPFDFKSHRRNLGIQQHALIAALKLSSCYGPADIDRVMKEPHVQHDQTIFEFDNLHKSRSIYFSNGNDNLPIVIDSGASLSITPN